MDIRLKFFPKYHFLVGFNVMACETIETSTDKRYDSFEVELGIGIVLLSISLYFNKKGSN
jgi:hypothetical protein